MHECIMVKLGGKPKDANEAKNINLAEIGVKFINTGEKGEYAIHIIGLRG